MRTPWPGLISRFHWLIYLDAGRRRELHKPARLATHCSRRVFLYHVNRDCARGVGEELDAFVIRTAAITGSYAAVRHFPRGSGTVDEEIADCVS
jgi:hypothetical protein